MNRSVLCAAVAACVFTSAAVAEDIKIGVILGFTGPIESLTPDMAAGGELAMKEVSDSGALLGGSKVMPVRADGTCVDAAAAQAAVAVRLLLLLRDRADDDGRRARERRLKARAAAACEGRRGLVLPSAVGD